MPAREKAITYLIDKAIIVGKIAIMKKDRINAEVYMIIDLSLAIIF